MEYSVPAPANSRAWVVEKRRVVFGILVTTLLALFAWQVLRPHEPNYQGQPLSFWLQLNDPRTAYEQTWVPSLEATRAICAMGPEALPTLLRLVATRETHARRVLAHFAREFPFLHLPTEEGKDEKAVWAFKVMGSTGKPAVPELMRLLDDRDAVVQFTAARCLGAIGPAASEAVPALIAAVNRATGPRWQDAALRDAAAGALGQMGAAGLEAVPHLAALTNVPSAELALINIRGTSLIPFLERLKDTSDPRKWCHAARLVADLGPNAEPAVPLLLSGLNSTNHGVQEQGLYALARIRRQADLCVPAMIGLLDSAEPNVRYRSLLALRAFGKEATAAVPSILRCVDKSRQWIWLQREATNALNAIDPEAAAGIAVP